MNILELKRKAQGFHLRESDQTDGGQNTTAQQYNANVDAAIAALAPQVQAAIKAGQLKVSVTPQGSINALYTQSGDTQQIYDTNGNFVKTQAAPSGGSLWDRTVNKALETAPLAFMAAATAGAAGYGPLAGGNALSAAAAPATTGGLSALDAGAGVYGTGANFAVPAATSAGASAIPTAAAAAPAAAGGGIFGTGISGTTAALTGAQLLGAKMGSDAAKSAADTQAASARDALALQTQQYNDSVARSKPFYDTSVSANNRLSTLMGLTPGEGSGSLMKKFSETDFQGDPGYQFRLSEGQKQVDNSAAARGMTLSGGAMKALQKYGQDFASNEYGNAYNRFNTDQTNQFNKLSSVAGGGQVANNVNSLATNYGQTAGNLITSTGAANAAGQVGSANAWSGGLKGVVDNYTQNQLADKYAIGNYQQNQLMNLLQNKGTA